MAKHEETKYVNRKCSKVASAARVASRTRTIEPSPEPIISEADFRALKTAWRSSPLALFLTRHLLCRVADEEALVAWLESGGLRCWCRRCGDALDVEDFDLPTSQDDFWLVLCVGAVTDHPQLFGDDPSGETLSAAVNRMSRMLGRAALLSTAGGTIN